ncbi:MAG TPA: 50S ribosomal protein L11 methyltransferase [Candidatus Rifleibacterium sp.]|nr:50S ribosomal protein L11 methyltransferase [Candidatus Rifleibacterium sp.]HPT48003.1 50S ribosomal protein L11 methyltransferase [Candidatus Rifleibacterium sp.]
MLRRFNVKISSDYEEQLLGLADRFGVGVFSSPQIRDEGPGETDFVYTGETVVSFIASTVEQDVAAIETAIKDWLIDFSLPAAALTTEEYSDNQDWMAGFREHFKPICVGRSIVVRPPWEPPLPCESAPGSTTILIDPGMAFGTGTHETTRLCLDFMTRIDPAGRFFLDLGAGSGILSFYLMKHDAAGGVAIEIEGAAVENMRKNAALNGISDRLKMICADLGQYKPEIEADGIVANITTPVILEYLPVFSPWVKKGGWGIFSGVNSTNAPKVIQAFARNGWSNLQEKTDGDWHGFYLTRD